MPNFSSFIDNLLIRADPSDSNKFFFTSVGGSTREDSLEGDEVDMNFVGTKILDYLTNSSIALRAFRNVVQFFKKENNFFVALVSWEWDYIIVIILFTILFSVTSFLTKELRAKF